MLHQHQKQVKRLQFLALLTVISNIFATYIISAFHSLAILGLILLFAEGLEIIYRTLERIENTVNVINVVDFLDDIEDIGNA